MLIDLGIDEGPSNAVVLHEGRDNVTYRENDRRC